MKISLPKACDDPFGSLSPRVASDCPGQRDVRCSPSDSPVIICLKFYESFGSLLSHVASTVPDCEDILSGPLLIMKFDHMLMSGSLIISHEKFSSCSSHSFAALVYGFLFHMLTLDIDSGIIYVDFGFLFVDDDKFLRYLLSRHVHRKERFFNLWLIIAA